jgi:hypothetical protein
MPESPKPRWSRKRVVWTVVASVFGMLVVCGIYGAIVGKPPATAGSGAANAAATQAATTATRPTATAPHYMATSPPARPTTAQVNPTFHADKAGAEKLLLASDNHYRTALVDGMDAFDTPAFAPWYQKYFGDMTDVTARNQALDLLGNVNNDQVDTWFSDDSEMVTDFNEWASQALMAEPGSQTDQMTSYAAKFQADLVLADKDAVAVGV